MIFCVVCRLTFCWRWCIMKIWPAAGRRRGHFDEKRGATPLLAPAHIQKLEQIFVLVRKCNQMSSVKCSASISHPMRLIISIAAAWLSAFKPYCFCHSFSLSAFPLNQERKGLQADLPLWGRLTRPNATRPAPFCYRQSEWRERLQCGGYSQP